MVSFMLSLSSVISAQPVMVAHYTFDNDDSEVVIDEGDYGYDAIIFGTGDWDVGKYGNAFKFDGSTRIKIPGVNMDITSDNGAVSLWMYCKTPTDMMCMFWAGDSIGDGFGNGSEISPGTVSEMHVHIENAVTDVWAGGELSFVITTEEEYEGIGFKTFLFSDPDKGLDPAVLPKNPINVADSTWHHVVATWSDDDSEVKMYIDGNLISSGGYTSKNFALDTMYLGAMQYKKRTYTGLLDDVMLWDGPLTDDEVSNLFKTGSIVGINSISNSNSLSVYPNPTNGIIHVMYNNITDNRTNVSLISLTGQVVLTKNSVSNNEMFDISNLEKGVYILKLDTNSETIYQKVVIE